MSEKRKIFSALIIALLLHSYLVYELSGEYIARNPTPFEAFLGVFLGSSVGTIVPLVCVFIFLYLIKMGFEIAKNISFATFSVSYGSALAGHFSNEGKLDPDNFLIILIGLIIGVFLLLWLATKSRVSSTDDEIKTPTDEKNISSEPIVTPPKEPHSFGHEDHDLKICPFCAEEIRLNAIKCKHCHSDLTQAS